jgi:hypothetical protein
MATKEEKRWMNDLVEVGCIVCRLNGVYSPPDIHHVLRAGKRQSHLFTIPLCPIHHRSGNNNEIATSRHPYKREFERRYGTENELLEQTKLFVNELRGGK